MQTATRNLTLFTLTIMLALPSMTAIADNTQPPAAPFYVLLGTWQGQGEFGQTGQAPAKLTLNYQCQKTSAGWGVLCTMKASNKEMTMEETDLFGHDPVSNTSHWYAVTNTGETHDHTAKWIDARTMKASYSWTQEGANMKEDVMLIVDRNKTLLFESVVSQDNQEVARFSGTLRH